MALTARYLRRETFIGVYKGYHYYDPQYLSEMLKKQRDDYHTTKINLLYSTNVIVQRNALHIVLSMKGRECGISCILLPQTTDVK